MKSLKRPERRNYQEINLALFKHYVRNNRHGVLFYTPITLFFLFLKTKLYGYESREALYVDVMLMIGCACFLVPLQRFYAALIENPVKDTRRLRESTAKIMFCKAASMVLWLMIFFMPLKSTLLYDHILGYVFVAGALAYYSAAGASYLPLFLCDLAVCSFFGITISVMNFQVQETRYALGLLIFLMLYALYMGMKLNRSTVNMARQNRQLEIAANRAEQANKAKTDFLSFMSHEIRTPMSGIMGMVNFLHETILSGEQSKYISTIRECSKTLLNTLNDALDINRIEAGKLILQAENFNLHALLRDTVTLMDPAARAKGLNLACAIDENVPSQCYADPYRLRQVVTNLISNAIKFTLTGSVSVGASIKSDGFMHITVADTGVGISPEDQKKLFQNFVQIGNRAAPMIAGSGLGLSICANLVRLMGGKIGMESRERLGTTFWFDIPFEAARTEDQNEVAAPFTGDFEMPPLRLLLIEDNPINQMITIKYLEKQGHKVTLAANGVQAINMMRVLKPDLVLVDYNLPDMNGAAVAEAIRQFGPPWSETPIVAITADISMTRRRAAETGIADILFKPFEAEDIKLMLARHARRPYRMPAFGSMPAIIKLATVPPSPPSPNTKLSAIEQEFGPEYVRHHVRAALDELAALSAKLRDNAASHSADDTRLICHEIASISGGLGMKSTYEHASYFNRDTPPPQQDAANRLANLLSSLDRESSTLKQTYMN